MSSAAEVGVAAAAGEDASSAAGDVFLDARAAVEALYDTKETFFTADPEEKESRLQNESHSALQLLDSIPPGIHLFPFHAFLDSAVNGGIVLLAFGLLDCCLNVFFSFTKISCKFVIVLVLCGSLMLLLVCSSLKRQFECCFNVFAYILNFV